MKHSFRVLTGFLLLSALGGGLAAKSRIGEYYLGFGYSLVDGDQSLQSMQGDVLSIFGSSPQDTGADWRFHLNYGNYDFGPGKGDDSAWDIGIDYLLYYDGHVEQNGIFRPYLGLGVDYMSNARGLLLDDNGFNWNFTLGTELLFTDELSMYVGGSFYGMWSDFGENDWAWDVGLTWWINDVHGLSLDYQRPAEKDVNFIGLKYLYSWQ